MQLSREEGIRTLDTVLPHTRVPGVRLRPLGHLSVSITFNNLDLGVQLTKNYTSGNA